MKIEEALQTMDNVFNGALKAGLIGSMTDAVGLADASNTIKEHLRYMGNERKEMPGMEVKK